MSEQKMVGRHWQLPSDRMTVAALIDWCAERDVDPTLATISGGHVKWESPQTADEKERSDAYQAARDRTNAQWERDTYDRLRAKFEATPPPEVSE